MFKKSRKGSSKTARNICFGAVGEGRNGERFIRVIVRDSGKVKRKVWFRTDNVRGQADPRIDALNRMGANLITSSARNEFLTLLQDAAGRALTHRVATTVGPFADAFVLPHKTYGNAAVGRNLGDIPEALLSWSTRSGDHDGACELVDLFRGNSRCILALGVQFVGPLSMFAAIEAPAFQFVGPGDTGKSTLCAAASSIWGWRASSPCGAGEGWNTSLAHIERVLAARNGTAVFFDETHLARAADVVDAVFLIRGGEGRGRYTETRRWAWFVPVTSTSNLSMSEILANAGRPVDRAALDRMIDLPCPDGGQGMYEDLHDSADVDAFAPRLWVVARMHHGVLGRAYLRRLVAARGDQDFDALIRKHVNRFRRAARDVLERYPHLGRAVGYFGVVYAALRVARLLNVIDIEADEARAALLTCFEDHARFTAPTRVSPPRPSKQQLVRDHVVKHQMVDLAKPLPRGHSHKRCPGYRLEKSGRTWIAFASTMLDSVVGGASHSRQLLEELDVAGAVRATGHGKGKRFAIKIAIGSKRRYAVLIDEAALATI